jgi:NTE family protein
LAPLHLKTTATDVIVIGINPLLRADVPRTAREIINRIDDISFNAASITELAAIAFIEQSTPAGMAGRTPRLLLHVIDDSALDGRVEQDEQ